MELPGTHLAWRKGKAGTRRSAVHTTLTIAVIAAAGVLAPAAIAGSQTPFSAAMSGIVDDTSCGVQTICLTGTDVGIATHLGLATLTKATIIPQQVTETTCDNGALLQSYTERATLIAANGDTLTLSGGGIACPIFGRVTATGELIVTGGTGRFTGATGSLAESIDHNRFTQAETVTLHGTISTPGST